MKFLVNPFLLYLLLLCWGLVALQRHTTGRSHILLRFLLISTLLLAVSATPLTHRGLELSLMLKPVSNNDVVPAFIFVLGGGYNPGVIPDEDVLSAESQKRVLHGVTLWRRYPKAHLVFSGAVEYPGTRQPDRHAQLMAEAAMDRGVPETAILLESRSRNTREHPVEALRLPGVMAAMPIDLVTSGWHMRRARQEFRRYFEQVQTDPVPEVESPMGWLDLLPTADALDANTNLLCEWVGILWYDILNMTTHQTI